MAALNFLVVNTPRYLLGNLARQARFYTGEGGITRLFELMVDTENIPVIYRTEVDVR